ANRKMAFAKTFFPDRIGRRIKRSIGSLPSRSEILQLPARFIHDFSAGSRVLCLSEFGRQFGYWLKQSQPVGPNRIVPPAQDIRDENVKGVRIERGHLDFPKDHVLRRELFER